MRCIDRLKPQPFADPHRAAFGRLFAGYSGRLLTTESDIELKSLFSISNMIKFTLISHKAIVYPVIETLYTMLLTASGKDWS